LGVYRFYVGELPVEEVGKNAFYHGDHGGNTKCTKRRDHLFLKLKTPSVGGGYLGKY